MPNVGCEQIGGWTQLSRRTGSPFHSAEFCATIQQCWPGDHVPRHVTVFDRTECRAIIPAYLYGSCPRLDYYRSNVSPVLKDRVVGAHALVAWYGYPIGQDDRAISDAIERHLETCRRDRAMSFFFGVDGRDTRTLDLVRAAGYQVARFHTNMVLSVSPEYALDPLQIPKKQRDERRRIMRRAEEAGVWLKVVQPSEALPLVELVRSAIHRAGLSDDILPAAFVRAVLRANLPGLEALLAMTPDGRPAALSLNFVWGTAYYLWLGGNDRLLAKPYYPSDFLYQHAIRRASSLGLSEIQAGRSPYAIKQAYGFRPVPIMAAVHPAGANDPATVSAWLTAQEARHLVVYPEVSR
jgi:hypothetical protein